ncbi:unnamed protein product [Rangifer tarandus platyrhynchus]|uniref:Uncharacterized protein n=2 Tax=Rangifer tarandus platyrhynchus TaxID=3082113 RepID=A0ABN8Y7R0_RANTA|nr:unnamed protein product [Rangifer tarandus platyrhynchus]CAI9696594.1 unnamed protein product [Rangifer tarandus platyrhynchus]
MESDQAPLTTCGGGRERCACVGCCRLVLPQVVPPPPPPPSHLALLLAPCSLSTSGASDPILGHLNWPEDLPPDQPSGAALCSQMLPQPSPADP